MKRSVRTKSFLGVALVPLLVALSGCGRASGDRVEVQGRVTVNGAALEEGMIVFTPLESPGNTSAGGRIVAGAYQIGADRGPRPGRFKVEIKAMRKTGRKVADTMGGQVDEVEQFLPPRFNRQSELVAQIEDQDRVILDFELTP